MKQEEERKAEPPAVRTAPAERNKMCDATMSIRSRNQVYGSDAGIYLEACEDASLGERAM